MIKLHGAWCDRTFWVWGEELGKDPTQEGGSLPHYGLKTQQLRSVLSKVGLKHQSQQALVLWLPTVGSTLVAATEGATCPAVDTEQITLQPFGVNAVPLDSAHRFPLLYASATRQMLVSRVMTGCTLSFWAQVTKFALSLVARQRFLPNLTQGQKYYQARWSPVLGGPDQAILARLAQVMPGLALALSNDNTSPPAPRRPIALLAFVEETVDYLVRNAAVTVNPYGERPTNYRNVHQQWVRALCSLQGTVKGGVKELDALIADINRWQHPLKVTESAPFRLCFRVEEPELEEKSAQVVVPPEGCTWFVRYLLQSQLDPSLQIAATDVWQGNIPDVLGTTKHVQECLLIALGLAARMSPLVEVSLSEPAPAGFWLSTAGVYDFLTHEASRLEGAGFSVMLPAWWVGSRGKVRLSARAHATSTYSASQLGLEQLVDVDWEVALGEERLSMEELAALARLKMPLVKVRGRWVELNKEDIESAQALIKKGQRMTARELVKITLEGETPSGDLELQSVETSGWITDVLGQLTGKETFKVIPEPKGFRGTLRPYQKRGYSWLAFMRQYGFGACLADDMGLGKTVQMLALLQADWAAEARRPVLLVCPTSVVGNWQREAARFTPELPVLVHHGPQRLQGGEFVEQCLQRALVITSYSLLSRDREELKQVPWQGVVLDEAQNIKNPETKQAQAACSLPADYRVALTGTPVENHVGDLWSIMEFLNPGWLGPAATYRRQFLIPIQRYQDATAAKYLKRITGPFILRRVKTDKSIIADLPDKIETKVFCTLTREQASLYKAVTEEMMELIEGAEQIKRRGLVLGALTKLKQICNHPALFLQDRSRIPGRSGKLIRFTEMLEEILAVGDRALVFTQYAQMGHMLTDYLEETFGREVLFLHGGVPKEQRDIMVERFQNEPQAPFVFILSLRAGGTGLTLTRANHVFHFDRWWNPAVENQATDRAYRIGQTQNVQVHKFICVGTLEERIDALIDSKETLASQVVGQGEKHLTELSTEELRELIQLQETAYED
ncbi:MAG: DEAD/DEAH box helicase [Limnochordia bacterium]|nr:DEAD/DEAH box helicase [Limnochordia bacterium]MDD2628577.1 DEAD/DEAH box helicase [Limnochordia bacterium]MDD4517213.1 DEAD/DEAH box helicase [Limnochordia bacterium]